MGLHSRRGLLAAMAGLAAAPLLGNAAAVAGKRGSPRGKLGIQLYMLGEQVGKDFEGTLRQLARIGYREVELPHFYNRKPQDLASAITAAGLACPSLHVPLQTAWPNMPTLESIDVIVDAAKVLGVTNIVVPLFPLPPRLLRPLQPGEDGIAFMVGIAKRMTADDWKSIARQLNEKGALLAKQGLRLSYHNHNIEFMKIGDRGTIFDFLVAETDPSLVSLELDIGWVAAAGLDPVALIERHSGRIRQTHLRDLAATEPNTAIQINSANAGNGIMDWARVLPALRVAGVEHYYVEREAPVSEPPMDAAKASFEFLHKAMAA